MENLQSLRITRRSFGKLGITTVAAPFALGTAPLVLEGELLAQGTVPEFYGLDNELDNAATRKVYAPGLLAAAPAPVQHMLFYYDARKGLVNPYNVAPDPSFQAGKKYSFEAEIMNYHTSPTKDNDLWKQVDDDLQLQLSVSTRTSEDELTWLALSAIRVFLGGKKSGTDQRLQGFQQGLEPTREFTGAAKIAIENGYGQLQLQVFGQKKRSLWSQLLKIIGVAADSFAFGVLPIPKLLSQGVRFTTSVLDHLQSQSRLVPILTSGRLPFRLRANVSDADFTMRPGTWVAIERRFAMASIDGDVDIPNLKVAVPGQFYEITDRSNNGIPVDYVVFRFRFPEVSA